MQRVDACFDEFTAIVSFRLVVRVVRGSLEASGAQLDAASVAVVVVVAGVNFHLDNAVVVRKRTAFAALDHCKLGLGACMCLLLLFFCHRIDCSCIGR